MITWHGFDHWLWDKNAPEWLAAGAVLLAWKQWRSEQQRRREEQAAEESRAARERGAEASRAARELQAVATNVHAQLVQDAAANNGWRPRVLAVTPPLIGFLASDRGRKDWAALAGGWWGVAARFAEQEKASVAPLAGELPLLEMAYRRVSAVPDEGVQVAALRVFQAVVEGLPRAFAVNGVLRPRRAAEERERAARRLGAAKDALDQAVEDYRRRVEVSSLGGGWRFSGF